MDSDYCRQADKEMLVEAYVAGKLKGDILKKFEEHLQNCEKHAQAVSLEKALKKGITLFARRQKKLKIQKQLEEQHHTRFLLLRYAAILLVAVITPLLIYYQFNIAPQKFPANAAKHTRTLPGGNITSAEKPAAAPEHPADEKEQSNLEQKIETKPQPANRNAGQAEYAADEVLPSTRVPESAVSDKEFKKASPEPALTASNQTVYEKKFEQVLDKIPGKLSTQDLTAQPTEVRITELDQRTQKDSARIRLCIRTYLPQNQWSAYRLISLLQIHENGEIDFMEIKSATFRSEELELCLANLISTWMISPGKSEQLEYEIHYPVNRSSP